MKKSIPVFVVCADLLTDTDSLVVVGVFPDYRKAVQKANKYAYGKGTSQELDWKLISWDKDSLISTTLENETIYITQKWIKDAV